jgi:hypothetical protein
MLQSKRLKQREDDKARGESRRWMSFAWQLFYSSKSAAYLILDAGMSHLSKTRRSPLRAWSISPNPSNSLDNEI